MAFKLSDEEVIVGRTAKDIKKYGKKGTGFLSKVVMSSGENPVLGRKILVDLARPHVVLICGKRGGGKCLTGNTEIQLDNGSTCKIKDLAKDKHKIIAINTNLDIIKAKKTEFYERTINKLLKVKLRTGKEIELTPEHPLYTINGWQEAQKLKKGSRIATPRILPFFGKEKLEAHKVKLLAYLIAEGHTMKNKVWFTNTDDKIIADYVDSVKKFDKNLIIKKMGSTFRTVNNDYKREIIKNKRNGNLFDKGIEFTPQNSLKAWLETFGAFGKLAKDKVIPEIIYKLPKKGLSLFLNILFSCDGSIYKHGDFYRIDYSSASFELIKQVQTLLLRFGIIAILRNKETKFNNKTFKTYELVVSGEFVETFIKEVGFFGDKEKRAKSALKLSKELKFNTNIDTIPKELWDNYEFKSSWVDIGKALGYKIPKSSRELKRYSIGRDKLQKIAKLEKSKYLLNLAKSDIFWDEIIEIQEINKKEKVYDIVVPKEHNFVANNVIVHNSYTMSVFVEGFDELPPDIRNRMAVIVIDTVGIFWSMKMPNTENADLLYDWGIQPEGLPNLRVLVPAGKFDFYKENKLPVDDGFNIKTADIGATEWLSMFHLSWSDIESAILLDAIAKAKTTFGTYYGISEIYSVIDSLETYNKEDRVSLKNRFKVADSWGIFSKEGANITDIAKPGFVTVIDVSTYGQVLGMENVREIIVAILGKRLFEQRELERKKEEITLIDSGEKSNKGLPMIWMLIDEAHMFMPKDRKSMALDVLLEWVRVGRQPGLSLLLATQRPERLHPDAISQCDLFISMRLTAKTDIKSVGALRPSYLNEDMDKYFATLPRAKGFALILDDNSEKLWMVKIRPRKTWDAGKTASAFKK